MVDLSFLWQPWLLSALIAAIVAIVIFWMGLKETQRTYRKERQRAALEEWLRELTIWVDQYGRPNTEPRFNYRSLTNRQVIELNLARRDRYLAWWMHEMAIAIMVRRKEARESFQKRRGTERDIDDLLTQTGENLLAWHHGKLKSSDFHLPYAIRSGARKEEMEPAEFAKELKLSQFLTPKRMTWKRKWEIIRLLSDPSTGQPIVDKINARFVGRDKAGLALPILAAGLIRLSMKLNRVRLRLFRVQVQKMVLEYRIRRLERRRK